ncbi:hypothetical protein [Pseudooceanicola sp. MF1-13]|uniref:hypothetical protein n=1 Tax=Pseudooceanicola sp. MF1-13 TaxID=3379095 RepID=UPI00389272CD
MPIDRPTKAQEERYLERLLGADPTPGEIVDMWRDRHPRDQIPEDLDGLEIETIYENNDMPPAACLQSVNNIDNELWRARKRAGLGRLTGVLDAIDICHENGRMQPEWLVVWTTNMLGSLATKDTAKSIQGNHKQELQKLKISQRARTAHRVYRWCGAVDPVSEHTNRLTRMRFTEAQENAAKSENIDLNPDKMTQDVAFEIASFLLKDTWAAGSHETIRAAYYVAISEIGHVLRAGKLKPRQLDYLGWDLEFVRPNTLEKIGIPRF